MEQPVAAYALALCNVSVAARLNAASFALVPGEITGVVGPAGAGKSTLLAVAAGALGADTGMVHVHGLPAASTAGRRLIGYAPDAPCFPPALTVREFIGYCARLHASAPARASLIRDALEAAGLSGLASVRVRSLGRSELRRLALAQAALGERRVLVLDETLSGLDPVTRRDLRGRIAAFAADGVAVLIAASDPAVLEPLVARVLVLRNGSIVRAGPIGALLRDRVLEVVLDRPPVEPPPGFRLTATGVEAPLVGRTPEAALALCRAHRLAVRATRVRVKSLEEVVLDAHDARLHAG